MHHASHLAGTTLVDRYRIERELGTGGMATVYLAHDIKHDRWVAVKVLRPELSAIVGAERFLNEIRTTANLQHPHILPLHDSGEINGVIFYVMPLVEGESLRDRLNREKQLPIDDAVRIAHDAAEALDYAHRHGVIHRDIKPENILLHDGRALVADFGIALAVSTAGGATRMTETGMSLGTPHYMSPEQAMGEREVTARSDVYALGCVLYEMLSGEPPFTGPTAQAIIAKVVTSDPAQLTTLRRTVPPHVAAAVHVALQRLPADRFASARDMADAISGTRTARMPQVMSSAARPLIVATSWRELLPWGLLAATAVAAAVGWTRSGPELPRPHVARFEIASDDRLSASVSGVNIALSPDGTQLLYRKRRGAQQGLVVRNLPSLEERELAVPGNNHRFSPDGGSLVFHQTGSIRKIRLAGGASTQVAAQGSRPAWGESGRIVYEYARGLWSVAESNGTPERLTTPDSSLGELRHVWADFLPGGNAVVFSIEDTVAENDQLAVVNLADRRVKRLDILGVSPHYVDGYLLYGRHDGTAAAVRFDLEQLSAVGPEVQVIDRLVVRGGGAVELAVANGTVAYIEGTADDQLVLVDNAGRSQPLLEERRRYIRPRPSPDGSRVAVTIRDANASTIDIWLLDIASKGMRRLSNDGKSREASWGANGESVIWHHIDSSRVEIRRRVLDGRSPVTTLWSAPIVERDSGLASSMVDPSGRWIIAMFGLAFGQVSDMHIASLDSTPLVFRPLIATQTAESMPAVSSDGRRLAYVSNESGRGEVYLTTFPVPSRAMRVSTGGGSDPVWANDGKAIYYRSPGRMIAARLNSSFTEFTTDTLFELDRFPRSAVSPLTSSFSIMRDGKFLMTEADQSRRLVMVLSFGEELRQRFAELDRTK